MVHRRRLHGTRQSTPLTGTCLTGTRLKTGIQPCCSGLQVQGTAISPSGATAYSIRSFVRFCKCKECKFVNLSQIGVGFRRKREPRGAGGRRKPVQTLCVKTGVRGRVPRRGRGRSPCFTRSPPDRRARRAGRRSRAEPGEGKKRYRRYALKRGFGGRVPRRGCGGGAPANGTCLPPDKAAWTQTLQCATSSIRAILLRSLSAHPNCPTDQS